MPDIYYATSNPVKFAEAQQFFSQHAPHITLKHYEKELIEIQSLDQKEIAIYKAMQAWEHLKYPVLAEDAGIYFEKYNKFPGTLTKFVHQGLGITNLLKLTQPNEPAFFQLHLVYYYGPNNYEVFKGYSRGKLIYPTQFIAPESTPFDDIFIPEGSTKTYSQLRQSNELSPYNYRRFALADFMEWYTKK